MNGVNAMPTVYEDQMRLARDQEVAKSEYRKLLRRSMWISIFLGLTVSVAMLSYAHWTKKWQPEENVQFENRESPDAVGQDRPVAELVYADDDFSRDYGYKNAPKTAILNKEADIRSLEGGRYVL